MNPYLLGALGAVMLGALSKKPEVPSYIPEYSSHISPFSISSRYPSALARWIDTHCIPTPSGYVKTSDSVHVYCMEIPKEPWIKIGFPFASNHPVICSQGNASAYDKTHFFMNTLFAVDLCSADDVPAGNIHAVLGGIAVVGDGCTHIDCQCHGGFGNNVRIVHDDGETYALYAHLSSVSVKTGDRIIQGQLIGVEGSSGMAGGHHLHFSMHMCKDTSEFIKRYRQYLPVEPSCENPTLLECVEKYRVPGYSIPFTWYIRYEDESEFKKIGSSDMKVSKKIFYGK
jgi:hypothetical protein